MTSGVPRSVRLPRALHPGAWWLWALGLATAASRTTNPLLLGVIIAVVAFVVAARRTDAPWARGFRAYVIVGLVIIAVRVIFRIVLDAQTGGHVLFTLPEIPLPDAAAGIKIGGDVSLEGVLAAFYDGLRLATLVICIGAANVLANPKRLLKAAPAALHELGVAVIVALTVAPQLVESAQRVRRARRLRGEDARGRHVLRQVAIPVMTDALERSLMLASSMDSRGYGRARDVPTRRSALTGVLVLTGLCGVCVGTYGLLDGTAPRALGMPMLVAGLALAAVGFMIAGQRVTTTRYRPDPWRSPEWLVAVTGVFVATVFVIAGRVDPTNLNPSLEPLVWPALPLVPTVAVLVAALPAWLAPPVELPARRTSGRSRRHAPAAKVATPQRVVT